MMQKDKKYIAFVCTGNTCRSPMAQGIFNKLAQEKGIGVEAESFGVSAMTGFPISEKSVEVCREIGVDISALRSTDVADVDIERYEVFYCMSQSHMAVLQQCWCVPFDKIKILGVSDPFGGNTEIYRMCRDEIYNSVEEIMKEYEN